MTHVVYPARPMRLAIFDLDHTLLNGDSDYLWGQFLVAQGLVDATAYARENQRFYDEYAAGTLDIHAFAAFSMAPLVRHGHEKLAALRPKFLAEQIEPIIAPGAQPLIEKHRAQGDALMILTATSRFITEPIAACLGIDTLLATEPERVDGRYTGRIAGTPCFGAGKLARLREWLNGREAHLTFYSDSRNDLPLLRAADRAIAVDPDDTLRAEASQRGWPIISLREKMPELT